MTRSSKGRTFPFWVLLGYLPVGLSLTLPTSTSSSYQTLSNREEPVATVYGFFPDDYSESEEDSDTPMPHIKDVFQALAQYSTSPTHATASPEFLESDNASATMTAGFTVTTPPMHGPGLVLLTSPVFPDVGSPTTMPMDPTPTLSTNQSPDHAGLTKHTAVVLGFVVGGIALFILCLFLLLVPSVTRKIFCCSWRLPKQNTGIMNNPEDQEKGANSQISLHKKSAPGTSNPADCTLVNSPNTTQDAKLEKVKDQDLDELTHQLPASKFSICSSDYVASSRNSEVSLVSSPYAVMPSVTFAPSPIRPPRPPTADSPALSESVYLACADRNYMIVTPEPLSEENNSAPRKRHLTPSEFLALHVPGILAGFSLSSSSVDEDKPSIWSKKLDRASANIESTSSRHSSKRSSRHSRTKSAPMLSSSRKRNVNNPVGDNEEATPLKTPGPIGLSLAKHRRSRSASGWAYPDRPRTRRAVNS